jgi:hypothetical protein
MASTGFWAGCFRRRGDVLRGRFLCERFFTAGAFWDFFRFFAGVRAVRDFVVLDVLILRAI